MRAKLMIFIFIIFLVGIRAEKNVVGDFQDFRSRPPAEMVLAIKSDLASKEPLRRDRAIVFFSTLINSAKISPKDNETLLGLACEKEIIGIASDIIEDRLAGWYEERDDAQERSMPMYYPLFYLLSISKSKTAEITLLMSLPAAGFDSFFRRSMFSNGLVLKNAVSRLSTLDDKLCCFFPGRNLVSDMQSIDLRCNLLRMYLETVKEKGVAVIINDAELRRLLSDCLRFGDENKGRIIRTLAVELAGKLIKAGQKDFLPAVQKIANSDPSYLYRSAPGNGSFLPQYEITRKYFPVREAAGKLLSQPTLGFKVP